MRLLRVVYRMVGRTGVVSLSDLGRGRSGADDSFHYQLATNICRDVGSCVWIGPLADCRKEIVVRIYGSGWDFKKKQQLLND